MESQGGIVIARDEEIGPAILIEVQHCEGFGIARHEQAALGRWHRSEAAMSIAAQQLAKPSVKTADRGNRRIGILHRIDVGMTIAVKIPGDHALQRRDLRDAGQRFESISAIVLAQKHPTPELRSGEAPGGRQPVLAQDLAERRPGIGVVSRKTLQHGMDGRAQVEPATPRE